MDRVTKAILFVIYPLVSIGYVYYQIEVNSLYLSVSDQFWMFVKAYVFIIFIPLALAIFALYFVVHNIVYGYAIMVMAVFTLIVYLEVLANRSVRFVFSEKIFGFLKISLLAPVPICIVVFVLYFAVRLSATG